MHFCNRPSGRGGGVALLIRKDWQTTPIAIPTLSNCEAIGVTLTISASRKIEIFSIYCPNGNSTISSLLSYLSNRKNECIIGGDFNGHSPRWTKDNTFNTVGREIGQFLTGADQLILITPRGLTTRMDPSTRRCNTLDLLITHPSLAYHANSMVGPFLSSDHFPILTELNSTDRINKEKIQPRWTLVVDKWPEWNRKISDYLRREHILTIANPKEAFKIFYTAITQASKETFRLKSNRSQTKYPQRPWWNPECSKRVALCRKAWRTWTKWFTPENKSDLNRAIAEKKKIILTSKRNAWDKFLASINMNKDPKATWNFVKKMSNLPVKSPQCNHFILPDGTEITQPHQKAQILAEVFTKYQRTPTPSDNNSKTHVKQMEREIRKASQDCWIESYNQPITLTEIQEAINQLKNTTMGDDLVHNTMLRNLDKTNTELFLHLLNLSYNTSYIPRQ